MTFSLMNPGVPLDLDIKLKKSEVNKEIGILQVKPH